MLYAAFGPPVIEERTQRRIQEEGSGHEPEDQGAESWAGRGNGVGCHSQSLRKLQTGVQVEVLIACRRGGVVRQEVSVHDMDGLRHKK